MKARLLIFLSLLCGVLGGAETPQINSILASVNGEPISLVDILGDTRNGEYQAMAIYSGERLAEEIKKIRLKAVNDHIDKMLLLEAYRERPFDIPNQSVEEELDNIAERMGVRSRSEFTRKLRESGTTIEAVRKNVEEYIIAHMMIYDQIRIEENITPREVYDYYEQHKNEFITPEKVALAMIMLDLKDPELEEKIRIISDTLAASPDAFADLAKRYSTGPDSQEGGNLGEIERKRIRAEFAAAMPELTIGKIYGPIRTQDGVTFLRLLAHTKASKGEFRALSAEIRRKIDLERREKIRDAYLQRLREKALIRYFF
ncbi:MAG: peptidylprolyl isomerase [Victivallales bacterium]|jgi:peptidyl-prolyl cis-trans isomerase SurA|nr:peptidylprolyl isomerase [Victivallales bacterium]